MVMLTLSAVAEETSPGEGYRTLFCSCLCFYFLNLEPIPFVHHPPQCLVQAFLWQSTLADCQPPRSATAS
jgi:hypothetical protein